MNLRKDGKFEMSYSRLEKACGQFGLDFQKVVDLLTNEYGVLVY